MRGALLTILIAAFAAFGQTSEYEVKRFREIRDKGFRNASETPLKTEDFKNFKGLEYFDLSDRFAIKAKLEKTTDARVFLMPTSAGTTRRYLQYGVLTFELEGKSFSLIAFQTEGAAARGSQTIFVPFRDRTNGRETYPAGRYLDIKLAAGASELIVDFNFSYNPLCAYGRDDYSCTLPPKENLLDTEIKAGEKMFKRASEAITKSVIQQ